MTKMQQNKNLSNNSSKSKFWAEIYPYYKHYKNNNNHIHSKNDFFSSHILIHQETMQNRTIPRKFEIDRQRTRNHRMSWKEISTVQMSAGTRMIIEMEQNQV